MIGATVGDVVGSRFEFLGGEHAMNCNLAVA